jgi:uncharacterized membrane protein YjfL (UPF0719 family)
MIDEKILLGIYQVFASLLIAILAMYISFSFLYKRIFKKYNLLIDNTAYAILTASVLFSVAYLISGTTQCITTTIKILKTSEKGTDLWLDALSYTALFMFIGLFTAMIINFSSAFIFSRLTKSVDEIEEIKKNNYAVSLITGSIIIGISMIVRDSMIYTIESIIPYPNIPGVY